MQQVLILKGSLPVAESTASRLYDALQQLDTGIEWSICSYTDLTFHFSKEGPSVFCQSLGRPLEAFDLVYLRDFRGFEYERNACANYLQHHSTPFLNSDVEHFQHISKLTQYMVMNLEGLPIPDGVYGSLAVLENALTTYGGLAVLKDILGVGGSHNYLVKSVEQLRNLYQSNPGQKFIMQRFIPNDFDLRVTVVGDGIGTISKRQRTNTEDHRNNVKQGAHKTFMAVETVDLELQKACIAAAQLMSREIAGVDVIIDKKDGLFYIIEVNLNFGMDSDQAVPPEVEPIHHYIVKVLNHGK